MTARFTCSATMTKSQTRSQIFSEVWRLIESKVLRVVTIDSIVKLFPITQHLRILSFGKAWCNLANDNVTITP